MRNLLKQKAKNDTHDTKNDTHAKIISFFMAYFKLYAA